ncbi:hypothetical protein K438DRAFT_2142401 [Mycena galopus ATCC 62051]|nr:hypothetical protein K438DRAFT_2142401 [Mycena galopus ATCC 62051]
MTPSDHWSHKKKSHLRSACAPKKPHAALRILSNVQQPFLQSIIEDALVRNLGSICSIRCSPKAWRAAKARNHGPPAPMEATLADHQEGTLAIGSEVQRSRVYSGLEVVNETHCTTVLLKMPNAITRMLVSEKLWFGGQKHLGLLLELSLPGVDLNDPVKTSCATTFIVAAIQHIPIGDLSMHTSALPAYDEVMIDVDGMDAHFDLAPFPIARIVYGLSKKTTRASAHQAHASIPLQPAVHAWVLLSALDDRLLDELIELSLSPYTRIRK